MRVKFKKGKQREFIGIVLQRIGAPSLAELIERGINVNYQTLKNYYLERRLLPFTLFEELCFLSGINDELGNKKMKLEYSLLDDNWGRTKGGLNKRKKENYID